RRDPGGAGAPAARRAAADRRRQGGASPRARAARDPGRAVAALGSLGVGARAGASSIGGGGRDDARPRGNHSDAGAAASGPGRAQEMSMAGMFAKEGGAIPLIGVEVTGEVLGAWAEVRVRQRYRNIEPRPVEAVYTFPLPSQATLIGFAMTC